MSIYQISDDFCFHQLPEICKRLKVDLNDEDLEITIANVVKKADYLESELQKTLEELSLTKGNMSRILDLSRDSSKELETAKKRLTNVTAEMEKFLYFVSKLLEPSKYIECNISLTHYQRDTINRLIVSKCADILGDLKYLSTDHEHEF